MQNVYTVKQVNAYIKNMFTQDFMLSRIYLKGEVSNCKYHTSGHIYFSLKDESGSIACVMFAGNRNGLAFRLTDGMQVVVFGAVSVYERDGRYQMYAREIRQDGAGELYERFLFLKKELEEMGMFSPEYKQPIPRYAKRIGVVTAPTGAAIRDIIHIAGRRNPYVQIILYPALVQGEQAAASIVKGIRMLETEKVDVMIVGRGGGSLEDLWAFNEEMVARAIFECQVPVISAVGHETDTTIADYVADLRAPTPSAAAELAVFSYEDAKLRMKEFETKARLYMRRKLDEGHSRIETLKWKLKVLHPQQKIREQRQQAADTEEMFRRLMDSRIVAVRQKLAICAERMKGVSPLHKLSQGYAYVSGEDGRKITSVTNVQPGDKLSIYVSDGRLRAKVEETQKGEDGWKKRT